MSARPGHGDRRHDHQGIRTRKDAWLAEHLAELDPAELVTLEQAVGILERLTEPEAP